jgi:hypothetical protein
MPATMSKKKTPGRKKDPASKRSLGLPRHVNPRFAFHLERELLDALGAYCDAQRLRPDASQVVRLALREYLEREGFWPWPPPGGEAGAGK